MVHISAIKRFSKYYELFAPSLYLPTVLCPDFKGTLRTALKLAYKAEHNFLPSSKPPIIAYPSKNPKPSFCEPLMALKAPLI